MMAASERRDAVEAAAGRSCSLPASTMCSTMTPPASRTRAATVWVAVCATKPPRPPTSRRTEGGGRGRQGGRRHGRRGRRARREPFSTAARACGQVPASSSAAWARVVAFLTAARARARARARLRASLSVVGAAQARGAIPGLIGRSDVRRRVVFVGCGHLRCRRRRGAATWLVRGRRVEAASFFVASRARAPVPVRALRTAEGCLRRRERRRGQRGRNIFCRRCGRGKRLLPRRPSAASSSAGVAAQARVFAAYSAAMAARGGATPSSAGADYFIGGGGPSSWAWGEGRGDSSAAARQRRRHKR